MTDLFQGAKCKSRFNYVIPFSLKIWKDVDLAKQIYALSPSAQEKASVASCHGADLVLGGHDHMYYISKGVTSWENFDLEKTTMGAEEDQGDILVVKSGTDFRDLSEIELELETTPEGSVRKKVITKITGKSFRQNQEH